MVKRQQDGALANAQEIILRFGGIRPMASKMDVPVTTVQGWKKRNIIPESRRKDVLEAASDNNIDLTDLLETVANENSLEGSGDGKQESDSEELGGYGMAIDQQHDIVKEQPKKAQSRVVNKPSIGKESMLDKIEMAQRQATKTAWLSVLLFVCAVGFSAVLLWPTKKMVGQNSQDIASLQSQTGKLGKDFDGLSKGKAFIKGMLPDDIQERFDSIKEDATQAKKMVTDLSKTVQLIQAGVLSKDAGSVTERIAVLESEVSRLGGSSSGLGTLLTRIQGLQQSQAGQEQLDLSFMDLQGLVTSLQGQEIMDGKALGSFTQDDVLSDALSEASLEDDALGETLDGVSPTEMKAAALLLTLTQFRKTLRRDNTPFENDLVLFKKLVGDDPELAVAIDALTPKAKEGVLSVKGLKDNFQGLAGEIVVASLSGEDVSVKEKAKARFNKVLQIEKEGELVTGTDTQATVARAQKLLDEGNIQGAMAELRSLEGEAAATAQPWLKDAEHTLMAQQLENLLGIDLLSKFQGEGGGPLVINGESITNITQGLKGSVPAPTGKLSRDEASGVSILSPGLNLP